MRGVCKMTVVGVIRCDVPSVWWTPSFFRRQPGIDLPFFRVVPVRLPNTFCSMDRREWAVVVKGVTVCNSK